MIKLNPQHIKFIKASRQHLEEMLQAANGIPKSSNKHQIKKPWYLSREYINYCEMLNPHDLLYITNLLSEQLDHHVQITKIDRNRIVEFETMCSVVWKTIYIEKSIIRLTVRKIKKLCADKAKYIDLKSIKTYTYSNFNKTKQLWK